MRNSSIITWTRRLIHFFAFESRLLLTAGINITQSIEYLVTYI